MESVGFIFLTKDVYLTLWPLGDFNKFLEKIIFKLILMTDGCDISSEIAVRLTSRNLCDDKSTLVQVMAWCRQATSRCLNQCLPRSLPPYGVTRPQWVLMRLEAQGFAGHLLQIIIVINIYNNQLKISVHPVISVITGLGRNLLHREKFSMFCSSYSTYNS